MKADVRILFWLAVGLVVLVSVWVLRYAPRGRETESPPEPEPRPEQAVRSRRGESPPPPGPASPRAREKPPERAAAAEPDAPPESEPWPAVEPRAEPAEWEATAPAREVRPQNEEWRYVVGGVPARQIADPALVNRGPQLSAEGVVAWHETLPDGRSAVIVYVIGVPTILFERLEGGDDAGFPMVSGRSVVWSAIPESPAQPGEFTWHLRRPPGFPEVTPPPDVTTNRTAGTRENQRELFRWTPDGGVEQITRDDRRDTSPSMDGDVLAWEKHQDWPWGTEIMLLVRRQQQQLTENFFYDLRPHVRAGRVAWAGWDGHDYEILVHETRSGNTIRYTDNEVDDDEPRLGDGFVVWEAAATNGESDIFMARSPDRPIRLSENAEDDFKPRVWNRHVVWQGFDGEDFEIFHYDGHTMARLTDNAHDDIQPEIGDGFICWMGYVDNFDAEIFLFDGSAVTQLTENDHEDENPQTAGGRVVWQAVEGESSYILLSSPRRGR